MLKRLLATTAALALFVSQAEAANIPLISGPWDPGNALGVLNAWITQSLSPNVGSPGTTSQFPQNLLDNGDMQLFQHLISGVTSTGNSNTTAGLTEASYGPDRWASMVNFTTGAATITGQSTSPTPPPGFQYASNIYRTSGALGPATCAVQELPFQKAAAIAGQTVDFSVYEQALSGLSADNGNLTYLGVITGTDATPVGYGFLRGNVGMTTSLKAVSVTGSATTNLFTYSNSLVAGTPVYFTAATMPTALTAGQTYYVSSLGLTGSVFGISSTYANAIAGVNLALGSAGTTVVANVSYVAPVWAGVQEFSAGARTGVGTGSGEGAMLSTASTLSASLWTRLDTGPLYLPTGITEAAVVACFQPNEASSGGTTDGFSFTGAQLEVLTANRQTATAFEFFNPAIELAQAQRYFYSVKDQAAHTVLGVAGWASTTANCILMVQFPTPMDGVPIYNSIGTITTTTFKINGYSGTTEATITAGGAAQPTTTDTANSTTYGAAQVAVTGSPLTATGACDLIGQTAQAVGLSWGIDF